MQFYHVSACCIHGLLNSYGYFPGLTSTKAYTALAIADHCKGCETKLPAAFHDFGYTIYRNKFFMQSIALRLRIEMRQLLLSLVQKSWSKNFGLKIWRLKILV
jgi:metal-dependent HD superfamily phosphatase/phosphodiesterase